MVGFPTCPLHIVAREAGIAVDLKTKTLAVGLVK